ncbi:hypothetical protein AAFF_G00169660 [Aldrovandia affinis]|uniref:Uncharacterized protein n=1 Tax=Aldrovandia affinis TaxID=143900 RepID=A0AAD7RPA8_9TELE|nr:hypothetical protein AAFF_G00169660 [Aldrovandia affinis]
MQPVAAAGLREHVSASQVGHCGQFGPGVSRRPLGSSIKLSQCGIPWHMEPPESRHLENRLRTRPRKALFTATRQMIKAHFRDKVAGSKAASRDCARSRGTPAARLLAKPVALRGGALMWRPAQGPVPSVLRLFP